jgi:hypothetical protein
LLAQKNIEAKVQTHMFYLEQDETEHAHMSTMHYLTMTKLSARTPSPRENIFPFGMGKGMPPSASNLGNFLQ